MLINKTLKYRIYPNKSTISRLDQWNSTLRCLWNVANEQRRTGYGRPSGEKIYPSYFSQNKELTYLRKEFNWIKDVPRHVAVSILDRLDNAWNRCFQKISSAPKWKKKSDYLSFTEFDHLQFYIKSNNLKFPKLPPIPIVISRPLEGKSKSCTIKRDRDQWFAFIVCEVEIPDPKPRTEPRVGIDRGVRNVIADSDGRLVENPKFLDRALKKLARAQRAVSRKVKGSNNREKAKNRVSRIHRTVQRRREHFLHVESTRYAKSHGVVVLEKLKTKNMIQIGGGLSRNIGDSAWGMFAQFLEYKLLWSGGTLSEVNPAYTSQTCAACNHVDRASRCGDRFRCTRCNHVDHADTNGAKIVLARWSPACQPVEASSQGTRQRSRKFKSKKLGLVD
jgi:putative transposase